MINWLVSSNRQKHLLIGLAIFFATLFKGVIDGTTIVNNAILGSFITLTNMLSVEYGQKTCGSKFDWLDVLAGTLIPFVLTIIIFILFILNKI